MGEARAPARDRQELAKSRTEWAEDRTILANERTFGSWARTGLASLAVALGFQALFRSTEPTWLAQMGASVFVCVAMVVFWAAFASSRKVLDRLNSHDGSPTSRRRLLFVTIAASIGSLTLLVALWLL
jgi:putative membrane protein